MKRLAWIIPSVLTLSCAAAAWASPAQTTFYVFRPLEGNSGGRSCAYAINNAGVVAGSARGTAGEMAVIWPGPNDCESINGTQTSRAVDINDSGAIVTQYLNSSWYEGFNAAWGGDLYYRSQQGSSVRVVVTDPAGAFATPTAVNAARQVAANGNHGDNEAVSFLLTEADPGWNHQVLPAEETYGVNDLGHAVGTTWVDAWTEDDVNVYMSLHGYIGSTDIGSLWDPGVVQPGEQVLQAMTTPRDVNNQDVVVGESTVNPDSGHAFVWQNGVMTDLGTLGGEESQARAINELGMIVGQANTPDGDMHAFVYHGLVGMVDLNAVVPAETREGMVLESANDVNDNGAIVGRARDEFGQSKGFVLRPGAFLAGAAATADIDPQGLFGGDYDLDSLAGVMDAIGTTISLDGFTLFGDSATLSIPYSEAMLDSLGISEDDLRLFWFDPDSQQWLLAGAESNNQPGGQFVLGSPTDNPGDFGVDTEKNLVWANIDHASTYGLFAVPEPATLGLLTFGGLAMLRRRRR